MDITTGSGAWRAWLADLPPADVVTTIIRDAEHRRGWLASLARTRSVARQVEADRRLRSQLDNDRRLPVLVCDEAAAVAFQQLRRARLRIGTMDLKRAAMVVSREATLLSRNRADVRQVPGWQVEDWTA
jgi:tRNA(fMet)-specific endonuclease VapC